MTAVENTADLMGHGDFAIGSDVWTGAAKVIEEMGEAIQVLGKLIGSHGDTAYWGGLDLRAKLVEELSDVLAAIEFFSLANMSVYEAYEIDVRSEEKRKTFERWHMEGDIKDQTQ